MKRFIGILLAVCMIITMLPTAFAEDAVAKVGEKSYTSLQNAIDEADGKIVVLQSDLTITSDLNNAAKGYFNIADGKKVTIDLNGKTIDVTDNSVGNFILFYNYGELTLKNGTVNITSTIDRDWNAQSSVVLNRGGILTIESGTYTHNGGTDMAITICHSGNSFGDAYMTVKEGTINSSYVGVRMRMADTTLNGNPGNGVVYMTVEGGEINGAKRGIWGQITNASSDELGTLGVTGGKIVGGAAAILMDTDSHDNTNVSVSGDAVIVGALQGDAADYSIKGGSFSEPVPEQFLDESITAELKDTAKNPDAPYSYYKSVEEAKAAAVGADAVVTDESGETIESFAVAFDANGGETDAASVVLFPGETLASLPEATREGYTFLGWFTAKEDGEAITTDTVFAADTTVYAQWEEIPVEEEEKKVEVNILPPKAESKPLGSGVLTAISAASNRMTITATAGEGGRITSAGAKSVIAGGKLTYAIITYEGYEIENVIVDGEDMGAISSYTFKNIRANHEISVTFKKIG